MPKSLTRYCVMGVYYADSTQPEFLTWGEKRQMVVFDTRVMARNFVPRMGAGRVSHEDATGERFGFSPIDPNGFNRIDIFTGYDPYDVPNGFRSRGIYSEAEGRDWQHHVFWGHVRTEMLAWCDAMEAKRLREEDVRFETMMAGV